MMRGRSVSPVPPLTPVVPLTDNGVYGKEELGRSTQKNKGTP